MALHFLTDAAADAHAGHELVLTGPEAHHAASVRRVRADEAVTIGDGRGVWLSGRCVSVSTREVVVRIDARTEEPAPRPRVLLIQALAKGDRDELAVQAATELGVDAIVPWQADRSVSRWDGKEAKGVARWSTIVREASKQAHRAWVPEVSALTRTHDLVTLAAQSRMLILEPTAETPLSEITVAAHDDSDIAIVIGPEGGIAPGELDRLSAAGAQPVRLGATVLRTSTAGAAALTLVNLQLGRW